jgi:hypothetical protein
MRYLVEHTRWKDGSETTATVPDTGQGAVDAPQDDILGIYYTPWVCPPSAPFCGLCNQSVGNDGYCWTCGGGM